MNYVYCQIGWHTNSQDVLDCSWETVTYQEILSSLQNRASLDLHPMYKSIEQTESKEAAPGSLDSSQRPRNSEFSDLQL